MTSSPLTLSAVPPPSALPPTRRPRRWTTVYLGLLGVGSLALHWGANKYLESHALLLKPGAAVVEVIEGLF